MQVTESLCAPVAAVDPRLRRTEPAPPPPPHDRPRLPHSWIVEEPQLRDDIGSLSRWIDLNA